MKNEHIMFIVFIYGKNDILYEVTIQTQIVKTFSNFILFFLLLKLIFIAAPCILIYVEFTHQQMHFLF